MESLIADSRRKISPISMLQLFVSFLLMPRLKVQEPYIPFKSNLPKHSIQRDKDAVAFH